MVGTKASPLLSFLPEVSGIWTIEEATSERGNPNSRASGTVQLDPFGQIYQASWLSGGSGRIGLAFYVDRYLLGGWGSAANYRLSLFHIEEDGSLMGYWVLPTSWGTVSCEVAQPDLVQGIDGLYDVSPLESSEGAKNSSMAHLSIRSGGELLQLGSSQFPNVRGLGLRMGDWLIANWCVTRNFGVMAYELQAGEARGSWTTAQDSRPNSEVWVKVG